MDIDISIFLTKPKQLPAQRKIEHKKFNATIEI